MLELKNINKSYGAVRALRNASVTLKSGEIIALLGANGSGKSTMVKVLGGSVKCDSGTILMDGKTVDISSSAESRRLGFSVAYQELSLIPRMTVCENVMLGHYIRKKPSGRIDIEENRKYVQELLDRFKIECSLDDLASDLSPSVRSMIEIIKAVSWKPGYLLLDEVTATLHTDEVEVLFRNMRSMAAEGVAIVMVTHRLGEIYEIADRAVILRGGESVADVNLRQTDMDTIVYHMTGKMPESVIYKQAEAEFSRDRILEVKNLVIGERVRNVSMSVRRGEIIGLGGLEGQGQSQFIRAIYGVIPYSSGEIRLNGKILDHVNTTEAVRAGIGFISGDRNRESIFSQRSIGENIYSAKLAVGSDFGSAVTGKINVQTQKIVDDYGIKIGKISDPVSSLSGGNQQKVVFGRWIFVTPNVLLLDDPTKGVDVAARHELQKFLKNSANRGMTVLMVSCDNDELLEVSDRICVFYEGRISAVLEGENKTEEKLVSAMMGMMKVSQEGVQE